MTATEPHRAGRGFWVSVAIGGAVGLWGVVQYLDATPDLGRRVDLARWTLGLALAHDLLLAPAVIGIGYLVSRLLPPTLRAPVQSGLVATGSVLLVAVAPLRGTARVGDNPTIQPLDYPRAVGTVLVVVWAAVLVWAVLRRTRPRSGSRSTPRTRTPGDPPPPPTECAA